MDDPSPFATIAAKPAPERSDGLLTPDQTRRLLYQAGLLRSAPKGAKLIVEWNGAALCFAVAQPAGKVE